MWSELLRAPCSVQKEYSLYNNILFFFCLFPWCKKQQQKTTTKPAKSTEEKTTSNSTPKNLLHNQTFTLHSAQLLLSSIIATIWPPSPPVQECCQSRAHCLYLQSHQVFVSEGGLTGYCHYPFPSQFLPWRIRSWVYLKKKEQIDLDLEDSPYAFCCLDE